MKPSPLPRTLQAPAEPYRCPVCKLRWIRRSDVRCTVLHAPGSCCHYGEKQADE